ncbi:MAG: hypothetical protein JWM53_6935, partial [bacterium]|nr:hypothetical protein [bacterium]
TINPDVTPQLEAIVMHSIEKDRNRRFQTMAEFGAAIENPDAHYQSWQGLPAPSAPLTGQHSGGTMMLPDGSARTPTGQGQRPNTGQRKGPTTQSGPTPTTLSGAASETYNGEPPRKSRAPLFAAIGGVVAIAAVIGVVSMGKKGDPTAGSLPSAAVQKDELVTVTVKSDPPGAKVTRGDNDQTGVTPWEMKVKRGSESFDVLVKMEGFASQTRSINSDRTYAVLVPLEKSATPTPPPVVQQAVNTTPTPPPATPVVDATAKDKHHHHSSSSSSKDKGDSSPDKAATKDKPAGKDKPAKGGKDEGDDMKLLQPKF